MTRTIMIHGVLLFISTTSKVKAIWLHHREDLENKLDLGVSTFRHNQLLLAFRPHVEQPLSFSNFFYM